ncbi:hypothetical protein ZIOFF_028948 [Zingiber officinale]|uniref:Uncharacterized protein n=1 Tax=Zingiber officinale TaxID=94328 RepID=A0A8J5GNU0_ZINOF|nr:hypothetical protein ZIOFF_028948 [Zingiber officinale]
MLSNGLGLFIVKLDYLLSPHTSIVFAEATTKSKLAALSKKLDILERRLKVLEVQVSSATTNPSVFT